MKIWTESKEDSWNKSKTKKDKRNKEIQRERQSGRKLETERKEKDEKRKESEREEGEEGETERVKKEKRKGEKENTKRSKVQTERDLDYFHIKHVFFPIITVTSHPPQIGMFLLGR